MEKLHRVCVIYLSILFTLTAFLVVLDVMTLTVGRYIHLGE